MIKIIGLRYGHSVNCRGARGRIDEVDSCRILYNKVKALLESLGYIVVDCNSNANNVNGELNEGTNKANKNKVDIYITLHMNSFNKSARGTECWCYDTNSKTAIGIATRICANISKLGTPNRGVKYNKGYHDLNSSNMQSIIVESIFCDNDKDAEIFNKKTDELARAIANGIDNRVSLNAPVKKPSKPVNKPVTKEIYRVRKSWKDADSQKGAYSILNNAKEECDKHKGYFVFDGKGNIVYPKVQLIEYTHRNIIVYNNGAEADRICAEFFAMILNSKNEDCVVMSYEEYKDKKKTSRSLFAVGGSLEGKFKYDKLFSGKDRNFTALDMLQHLKMKY